MHGHDYGELGRDGEDAVLSFVRRLPHSQELVWRALTEPEQLKAWFPTTIEGELRAGTALRFSHRDGVVEAFGGEMLACQPPSLLEFMWGEDRLRFELRPDGDGSVLTLKHSFKEFGKAARDAAGWHSCLDMLDYALRDQSAPWASSSDRWREVRDVYAQRMGPAASRVGPPKEWVKKYGSAD